MFKFTFDEKEYILDDENFDEVKINCKGLLPLGVIPIAFTKLSQ